MREIEDVGMKRIFSEGEGELASRRFMLEDGSRQNIMFSNLGLELSRSSC